MSEKAQINVKVDPARKKRWNQYQDESLEVNSMSDLIRLSVEKEIADNDSPGENETDHLKDISTTLNDIQDSIRGLESRMSRIEVSTQNDPEIDKLANEIFPILPDMEPGSRDWKGQREQYKSQLGDEPFDSSLYHGWIGTVESVAKALDVNGLDTRKALEKLVSDMSGRVRTTEHDGKERYWRDV